MMCRLSSILMVVATMVVLVAGDCMKNITLVPGGSFTGGYYRIKDPEKDPIVKKIVADSVKFYNSGVDDADIHFKDGDQYVAFRKVGKGELIYCCQFNMKERVCKGIGETASCHFKTKYTCSVKADQALSAPHATIDIHSLQCPGLFKPA